MTLPPPTRREDVVDILHGVEVPDPYRWLEDGDAAEVRQWVAAQNEHTRQALDARPDRGAWHERLVALMQLPVVGGVQVRGAAPLLPRAPRRRRAVPADPALGDRPGRGAGRPARPGRRHAPTRPTPIDWFHASPDGSLVAVGTSEGGSEDSVLRVLDARDGTDRGEAIPTRGPAAWRGSPTAPGFAYTRYPAGDQYHRTVHHHSLGDAAGRTTRSCGRSTPTRRRGPTSRSRPTARGCSSTSSSAGPARRPRARPQPRGRWTTAIAGEEVTTAFSFATDGTSLVGVTTLDAPQGPGRAGRARRAAGRRAGRRWCRGRRRARPPRRARRRAARRRDAPRRRHRPALRAPTARSLGAVDGLGDVVAVAGLSADRDTGDARSPSSTPSAPDRRVRRRQPVRALPPPWVAVPSRPTRVVPADDREPARATRRSTGRRSGCSSSTAATSRPGPTCRCILNGYGGFAIAETPVWSPQIAAWCAAGGTYAIAGLRGGLEEGEAWHHAGRRGRQAERLRRLPRRRRLARRHRPRLA